MTDIRELLLNATPPADEVNVDALRRAARRRRARRLAVIVVAVALAGSASAVALAGRGHRGRRVVVAGTSSTVNAAPSSTSISLSTLPGHRSLAAGVAALPSPPFSPRTPAAVVPTGASVAVWGGQLDAPNMGLPGPDRSFNDGAVYDSADSSWKPMSASPLPASRDVPVGVSTRDGVVFARGRDTALWDPATNTWRELGLAPAAVADLAFTGSQVVSYSADATLDIAHGTWRALPAPPVLLERATVAWTGEELVVIGGPGTPFTSAAAIALDPSRREWRSIATPPAEVHAESLAASWNGRRVVVVNYDMKAIAYDPARDKWSTLPDVPARFFEWSPSAQSVEGYTLVFMAEAVVVLTPDDTWVPVPYGAIPFGIIASGHPAFDAAPAGGVAYVFGVQNGANVFVMVDPERLAANPARLQVGTASVAVPSGYGLRAARYDEASDTVGLTLVAANDATCSVTSRYVNAVPSDFAGLTPEQLENDGAAKTWYRNPEGTEWGTPPTSSDTFDIKCTAPSAARALAESASFKYPA